MQNKLDTDIPFPDEVMNGSIIDAPVRGDFNTLERLTDALVQGQAAIEELNLLKPIFALALSKLPKKQLHVTLAEQATLGERFTLQAKSDGNGGILLRSVAIL